MIKFINLNNGSVYNGDMPYIHKFEGEQSVNLIYTLCLYLISDHSILHIKIEDNNIFKLLDNSKLIIPDASKEVINDIKYVDLKNCETNSLKNIKGIPYGEFFIYNIYFKALAYITGEYVANFKVYEIEDKDIVDTHVYQLGADFYNENELLKINLSNFGQEIPESIQKAIYTTNVREDKLDYITLNRKWKELLSNYWDIIANKGSYKSLYNSLKWFEYGDLVKILELWKHVDFNKMIYNSLPLNSIIIDKYESFLKSYYKTSYISLHLALLKLKLSKKNNEVIYNDERNPELEDISAKWSIHDLMLKMSLLGNFYKTYFMPIHLDLIHSTIEDIVFTNTIKLINTSHIDREDNFNSFATIDSDIKDGQVFYLNNISILVGRDTKLANRYNKNILYYDRKEYDNSGYHREELNYDNITYIIGVDNEIKRILSDIDEKTFWSLNYTGPGVQVKFNCSIVLDPGDYIKSEIFSYIPDDALKANWQYRENPNLWMTKKMNDIFSEREKIIDEEGNEKETLILKIPFNILCKEARDYELRIQFETAGGKIFAKNIKFKVEDPAYNHLTLYKIQHKLYPTRLGFDKFERNNINDLTFGRLPDLPNSKNNLICNLFIPHNYKYMELDDWTGILLSNILILTGPTIYAGEYWKDSNLELKQYLEKNYFIFTKDTLLTYPEEERSKHKNELKLYTICISKKFNYYPDTNFILLRLLLNNGTIYRNDYGYFPEFHEAIPVTGDNIEDYIITNKDTLCVVPNFKYGANIKLNDYEWIFENISTGEQIKLPVSIREPFITNIKKEWLIPGYYNIIFKYSLTNDESVHTMKWNSAFIKKD